MAIDDEGPERDLAAHGPISEDRRAALLHLAQMGAGLAAPPVSVREGWALIQRATAHREDEFDSDPDGDFNGGAGR